MNVRQISLRDLAGREALAGRLPGEALRIELLKNLRNVPPGGIAALDFSGIAVMTSSFFLGAFKWLWSAEGVDRDLFPVLVNVEAEVADDVGLASCAGGLKPLLGSLEEGAIVAAEPINLEDEELRTYRQVDELGEAAAVDLYRLDPKIQPTGWSNRLALLYEARLLRRRKEGRQLVYSVSWRIPDGRRLHQEAKP
jgi:hypothetical protein